MRKIDPVRHEEKRREILDAAVRCAVRNGFQGASISLICAEAGMSPGHLYHYFRNKAAIVDAIIDANLQRAEVRFARAAVDSASVVEVLATHLGDALVEKSATTPLLLDILAQAGRDAELGAAIAGHSRRLAALIADLLRFGQRRGEVDPSLDPDAGARTLISLFDGAKTMMLRFPDRSARESVDVMKMAISRLLSPAKL